MLIRGATWDSVGVPRHWQLEDTFFLLQSGKDRGFCQTPILFPVTYTVICEEKIRMPLMSFELSYRRNQNVL